MSLSSKILIICGDPEGRRALERALDRSPFERIVAATIGEARALLTREPVGLVLCAEETPDGGFRELLATDELTKMHAPVIVASRCGDTRDYLEAMRAGAFDFISGPYRSEEIVRIVGCALHPDIAA